MAFKMKRSGMNLRSTTSIQPKLTDVQLGGFMADDTSPLKQTNPPIQVSTNEKGGVDAITKATLEGDPIFPPETPSTSDACEDPNSAACKEYNTHKELEGKDPCYQYDWNGGSQSCGEGYERNPNPTGGDRNTCCMKAGQSSTSEDTGTARVEQGGGTTPRTNILTPREMRRNMRMMRFASDGNERLKKKANRNIRQAIRRGETPDQLDMDILSGKALGNMDGINIQQDSTGTTNIWTKQRTSAFQQNPGGEKIDPVVYQEQLKKEADILAASGEYGNEEGDAQKMMDQARLNTEKNLSTDSSGTKYEDGQYMTDRTKRTMRRNNADMSKTGKKRGQSQKKMDRNARSVTKYTAKLKGASKNGKFDPDNEAGMSKKQYDRINRKYRDKSTDNKSPFKKKESPVHMTVNVTKPSYKMGGFGSK
jgi:hypothetical protein